MSGGDKGAIAELVVRLPVAVALLDAELRVIFANDAFKALAGNGARDVRGFALAQLVPAVAARLGAIPAMVLESGQSVVDMEVRGGARPLVVSCFPAPPAVGLLLRDAPAAAEQSTLLEREAMFRAVFENAAVGMMAIDLRGGGFHLNPAFLAMLGYSAEEVARLGVRGVTHPDDYERDLTEFQRVMCGEIDHYQIEKRYIRRGGEWLWTRLFVSVARDSERRPLLVISMVEDVTELRRAAEDRERAIGALEEAVRARETFLAIASHELKTPLTPLKLNLQVMSQRGSSDADRAALATAIRQVDRLEKLVDSLLDVARLAAGQLVLTLEPLDLAEVVREVLDRWRPAAERAGSRLELAPGGAALVRADRVRMEQMLSNLLGNAIKFAGGTAIELEVSSSEREARVVVRDHGIGIDPADHERIFRRFERATSASQYGGLGLGLHIAREIAVAHGGSIRVESQPGCGATFVVGLPRG